MGDELKVLCAVHGEVGALRKVLAKKPVGVLVGAALPGLGWVTEIDLKVGGDPDLGVIPHL